MSSPEKSSNLLEVAERLLREAPLCDRCLGRLFARLGYGWDNRHRGEALKRTLVMRLHERIRYGDKSASEELKAIAPNIGEIAEGLYVQVFGVKPETRLCAICGSSLEEFIEKASRESASILKAQGARSFLIGVVCEESYLKREEEIASKYGLSFWESLKSEIRREVGKRVQKLTGLTPDFKHPDVTLVVKFPEGSIEVQASSLLIKCRYWKKGRMISQAYWPTIGGPRYFSIEEAATGVLATTRGESVVLHASGREDIDARMLGSGRPALVEVKAPKVWSLGLRELENALNSLAMNVIEFSVEGLAESRDVIRIYKEELAVKSKTYRALIAVEGGVSDDELRLLEQKLTGATILQRTPKRVLGRKRDTSRVRRVEKVVCTKVNSAVVECLIKTEGGLYVKELVSGDDNRTTPSFSEALGRNAYCIELDVVEVSLKT
ncbi:MAG: tRNA pseudouridine(54/55) synthase Pus10 [Acidilobaceae archaeon]